MLFVLFLRRYSLTFHLVIDFTLNIGTVLQHFHLVFG